MSNFLKINRIEALDEIDKQCEFLKNLTKNVDFITQTRNTSFQLKMATSPILIVQFVFNRVENQ